MSNLDLPGPLSTDQLGHALAQVTPPGAIVERRSKGFIVLEQGTKIGVTLRKGGLRVKVYVATPWWMWLILLASLLIGAIVAIVYDSTNKSKALALQSRVAAALFNGAVPTSAWAAPPVAPVAPVAAAPAAQWANGSGTVTLAAPAPAAPQQVRRLACPRCKAVAQVPAGQAPRCASCGFGA